MSKIHPTALIDPSAKLDSTVEVGPYSVIGPGVQIGPNTTLGSHVTVDGKTTLGRDNRIYSHAALGLPPQDKLDGGVGTRLEVGDSNIIREFVTMNTATERGGGITRIGSNNMFMIYSHVAHDCQVGDDTILSGSVLLGGHVHVASGAIISGATAVNQFVTIGRLAYIGGLTRVVRDVPPFLITEGNPQRVRTVNVIGMQRSGFSDQAIARIRGAYRILFDPDLPWSKALAELESRGPLTAEVQSLVDCLMLRGESKSGRALEARNH